MKKVMLSLFIVVQSFAYAQHNHNHDHNEDIPEAVQKAFQKQFKKAGHVAWEEEVIGINHQHGYKAEFEMDEHDWIVLYDEAGKWLETVKYIDGDELPGNVSDSLDLYYENNTRTRISYVENSDKQKYYMMFLRIPDHNYVIKIDAKGIVIEEREE